MPICRAALPAAFAAALALAGCASAPAPGGPPVELGELSRADIEAALPGWVRAQAHARADADVALALVAAPPGAEIVVYLGTWCGDSKRELARFWQALDLAAFTPSFTVRYVGVDRAKREPRALLAGQDIRYLPTFVVRRAGVEVGRIVESAPGGIESDLVALLRGDRRGVVSGRGDVGAAR